MLKIAVFVSGGGTNLQTLIDCRDRGELGGEIAAVISSRKDAYALVRAEKAGIKGYYVPGRGLSPEEYSRRIDELLEAEVRPDLIVLAGYLKIFSAEFCKKYSGRIINIHPSLIPSFCGAGMYGLHIHEAALARGVKVTGDTVHFVDAVTDGGPIIFQKAVEIEPDDTPEILQKRVMEQAEHVLLPRAVAMFCKGRLKTEGGVVRLLPEITD